VISAAFFASLGTVDLGQNRWIATEPIIAKGFAASILCGPVGDPNPIRRMNPKFMVKARISTLRWDIPQLVDEADSSG
jgi:hypothetical protein